MTEEAFSNDVSDGFMPNADGTVDVFDYLTWLVGRRLSDPPPRVPPTKGFDMASVSPATLAGWLTMYNHLGYDVPKSRLTGIISTYRDSVCAKDDESHFDFSRLLAFAVTHGRIRAKSVSAKGYEAHKAEMARRNREASAAGRDIGDIPEVSDPERRESCRMDFRLFCETYFHDSFSLKWSDDHLKCISKIEQCVLVGGLFALAMPRGSGKALALDTPLPTPSGWTTMGDVRIGDTLFDDCGRQCRVVMKSEVFVGHDCYRVAFGDGESIVCDAGHLWQVEDIYGRRNPYVRDTEWLSSRFSVGKRGFNKSRFRVPMQRPLETENSVELPVSPYALGVWLGNGNGKTPTIASFCDKSWHENIVELWLLGNNNIPHEYLRACISSRRSLLRGILDAGGHVDRRGKAEVFIKNESLAEDFSELLSSLGMKFSVAIKTFSPNGNERGQYHRFCFRFLLCDPWKSSEDQ